MARTDPHPNGAGVLCIVVGREALGHQRACEALLPAHPRQAVQADFEFGTVRRGSEGAQTRRKAVGMDSLERGVLSTCIRHHQHGLSVLSS